MKPFKSSFASILPLLAIFLLACSTASGFSENGLYHLRVDIVTVNGRINSMDVHLTPVHDAYSGISLSPARVTGYAREASAIDARRNALNDAWYRLAVTLGQVSEESVSLVERKNNLSRHRSVLHYTCIVNLPAEIRYQTLTGTEPLITASVSLLAAPVPFPESSPLLSLLKSMKQGISAFLR